ncbi:putative reverse transcriptase domain-containing protein [Tanacetum coccineum]
MVDIPDDIDLVDYDDEDPEEDPEEYPEEEPEEDVDIEIEDDAELIFPYEVEGNKTPPPGDVSSDSELTEAELSTNQTEIALLKSKNKFGEKKRELLDHDLGDVERTLGNVLERLKELKWGNTTFEEKGTKLPTSVAEIYANRTTEPVVMKPEVVEPWRLEQELVITLKLKGTDIDGYTNRFYELALLCPRMVEPEQVKVEQYISHGTNIQDKPPDEVSEGEKRKGEGDRGGRGDNRRDYNHRQNQRRANAGAMTNAAPNDNEVCPKCKNKKHGGDCWKCGKCGKLGHKTAACWSLDRKDVTCFNCNEKGHRKRDCPKLKKNGQGGNNCGAVYKLGAVDASVNPNRYEKKVRIPLEGKTPVIEGDRNNARLKIVSCIKAQKYTEKGCKLFLAQVTEQESKEKRLEDVPVIRDFPKELPGLPPPRQVEFRTDLIPGAAPVARAPYRLAPSEMKELSKQLQELSEKGFIRPGSSSWGAPVLLVNKKDGSF